MRSTTHAAVVATLALVLVAGLGAPSAVADDPAPSPVRLQLRTPVAEAVLGEAHASFLVQPLFDSPPGLEVLVAFSQPIVRGADDYVAVLWVRPLAGAELWSGVWWADSSIGATPPRKVTIYEEGLFLVLEGGARATSDRVNVTYTFVGQDARAWKHAMPPVPVLDALPDDARTVALSGAAASDHGHADIPEVVIFTPWNLLGREAEMGFTITDADGGALHDVRLGSCATGSGNLTENGCRVPFIADQEGAAITMWSVGRDGARIAHETHAVADIVAAPHAYGASRLARDPMQDPWLDGRVTVSP